MTAMCKIGLVGARGYTGRALLSLIANHPHLELAFASSRGLAGQPVCQICPDFDTDMAFETLGPEEAARADADLIILALPNGLAQPFVDALLPTRAFIIDLSADYRFDDEWVYGLPELLRLKGEAEKLSGARLVANPGCYATAMQLAIAPLLDQVSAPPSVFGVSGYSGAGTTPSKKNDQSVLADNLLPYALSGHIHEREATRHLGMAIRFTPHVHPAFSGIVTTVHVPLRETVSADDLLGIFSAAYGKERLISLGKEAPTLKEGTGHPGVLIGGFGVGEHYAVIVAAEDNLLKGAAVQAMQNINLMLGFDEFTAIAIP